MSRFKSIATILTLSLNQVAAFNVGVSQGGSAFREVCFFSLTPKEVSENLTEFKSAIGIIKELIYWVAIVFRGSSTTSGSGEISSEHDFCGSEINKFARIAWNFDSWVDSSLDERVWKSVISTSDLSWGEWCKVGG